MLKHLEVWFVTGSQHLYGPKTLEQVASNSTAIAAALNESAHIPVKIVYKPVVKTAEEILNVCIEANNAKNCLGLITWMHTFSPAKMWISGLMSLQKPFLHLHTQYNQDLPWSEIDMDFMNLNQAAHGDREFGFIGSRLRIQRKVVVGHWSEEGVQKRIGTWTRAAAGWNELRNLKVARFGDNMRNVAVTEGDKVEAQIRLGFTVHGYGIGDLVKEVNAVSESDITKLAEEIEAKYDVVPELRKGGAKHDSLRESAKIEIGLRTFLEKGGFKAFADTFEDLNGLEQLPGFAVQRLMADGYGFGAEGDWKTAALVRAMKVMATGLEGGTSFMEDYTYDFNPSGAKVLGAHMLEVCESIAENKPKVEIHQLGIGGKADPVRSTFTVRPGSAINASIMDMGNRFRLVVNEVEVVPLDAPMPKLPVASALWVPKPNLEVGAGAWILAGGAHHTSFSQVITAECMEDFAEMAGIEFLLIDDKTTISDFKKELKWNDLFYHLSKGI
ncbi:L-arabinose isomerase [Natronoflexus pectinivorans]|uniref:L-arabinose isomerase n=1 Tax=Natronoflexus pectinivorans TaxID=682526 RepID=A0A4V6NMS4_9BACT|nr:L-arabinose isomerase [Natronoflexus pectinivorans]TCO10711.1 L-arabinose isomerase [Natronoflexus pectinivorans]